MTKLMIIPNFQISSLKLQIEKSSSVISSSFNTELFDTRTVSHLAQTARNKTNCIHYNSIPEKIL